MPYPEVRLRRLRENPLVRKLVSENTLSIKDLVQPLFVKEGLKKPAPIASMPGQFQHSEASLLLEAKKLEAAGVPAIILFGIPAVKDLKGAEAFARRGVVQRCVQKIKKNCKSLLVITDICLCEYLSHGHCGHVHNKRILNDSSVLALSKIALSHARAGADIVAPSDMMDGRVQAIRKTLDQNNFKHLPILSYAVKYKSNFYAPFREAAESAPGFGDRGGYQMSAANLKEALREAEMDIAEGADMILVKPALAYGDVMRYLKDKINCPMGCYSVSGEYSMIKAAAERNWLDEKQVVLETHLSMKRAGASFILTYWAKDLAAWLKK
jgi:porphobilinogen synthase